MNVSNQEREQANSIIQKFIVGSSDDGLPPVNLLIGMSATPDRFNAFLQGRGRTTRAYDIDPADVRASGLIKDRIVLHPKDTQASPWTLLAEACRTYTSMCDEWASYCAANGIPQVIPALIIQIEDGTSETTSRTNLGTVIATLKENIEGMADDQIVHCLQQDKTLDVAGHLVRYADPSSISAETNIRVVMFKMALTTGWDCPRAETMISFRSGRDATYIAQLVGRMVRTPLAESVHGSERLNDVYLFLPFYDEETLDGIIERLTSDKEIVPATHVTKAKNAGVFRVDDRYTDVISFLRSIPSYRVSQRPKASYVRRLVKLSRLLIQDGINLDAREHVLSKIVARLVSHITRRLADDPEFKVRLEEMKTVTYRTVIIQSGDLKVIQGKPHTVPATEKDVETLFSKAKGFLTDDVAMAFWRSRHDEQEPLRAKVETYEIAQDEVAWRDIEQSAGAMLHTYFQQSRTSIGNLGPERQAKYEEIIATARRAESSIFNLPESIAVDVPSDAKIVENHIYVDEEKKFRVSLNTWEEAVLSEETERGDFVCWLRNFHRKPWSLAYVYEIAGEERPGFPDFISIRKQGATFVADILEPHQGVDSLPKAKGLAKYAERHGVHVGRVEMIRKDGAMLKRINLSDPNLRLKVGLSATRRIRPFV